MSKKYFSEIRNMVMSLSHRLAHRVKTFFLPPAVRDRIVVKSIDRSDSEPLKPGFIIGVYRSGTTLLRYILDSHGNIAVPPESNFLNGVADLWRDEWYRKGFEGAGVDEAGLRDHLRGFVGGVFDDYAAAKGKKRWFDKTPSYVTILDVIDAIFGEDCSYIMVYRHGLDVANSMAKMHGNDVNRGPGKQYAERFPDSPQLSNACYWAEMCEKMMAFEESHRGQCFRVHYEQISREPERYLPPMFEFLGEEWDSGVLNFFDKQHDFGLQDSKINETKGFVPNIETYRAWPSDRIAQAEEAVGATLKKLGYSI